jgi:malonate transporter and related proteins
VATTGHSGASRSHSRSLSKVEALTGYATIGILILVGVVCGHVGVLTVQHQKMMSKLALLVAAPALMFTIMEKADLSRVFARSFVANVGAIVIAALIYVILAALIFKRTAPERTMGMLLSCYTNAGNLGLPVAVYALGDATWIAPVLLVQLAILQPAALTHLDYHRARETGGPLPIGRLVTLPIRNPLTVACLAGLALNIAHLRLPALLETPAEMLGAVAVPTMLLAFGISLRLEPRPKHDTESVESYVVIAIKVLLQPLAAFLLARYALHLPAQSVRAVTVIAALPPAQNIYIFGMRYGFRELFARDVIFRATAVSAVVILVLMAVL